jgi:hypothetical protein
LPDLPEYYTKKLHKILEKIMKPKGKKLAEKRFTEDEVMQIREAFFQFFVNVF